MRCFLSLLVLIELMSFFHFGNAAAKNTSDVHPFKALFFRRRGGWLLRFMECGSLFRDFNFLYDWGGFSAMENSRRFHACFCFFFLLFKLPGNRPRRLSVLHESVFPGLCDVGLCDPLLWMRYGCAMRRLPFFSIFGQRFARKHHRTGSKCRRIDGVFGGRLGPRP